MSSSKSLKLILVIIFSITILTECTSNLPKRRIVGGEGVHIQNYRYQLSIIEKIKKRLTFRGGAVIVGLYWSLTSAHCIDTIDERRFKEERVYLRGNTSYWRKAKYSLDHKIVLYHQHPNYNEFTNDYDLALIKVNRPFIGHYEKPITLAGPSYKLLHGDPVIVSGWGRISNTNTRIEDRLRSVVVRYEQFCEEIFMFQGNYEYTSRMLCAWEVKKDACAGDSGGPLVHKGVLIGIVSWGIICAHHGFPGVYARISAFYFWLRSYEKQNKMQIGLSFQYKR